VEFGKKMYQTHEGLSKLYEVSCEELDFLVDRAAKSGKVIGARMMGGGFGGCVICLLKEEILDSFSIDCVDRYLDRFSFEPEVILFELGAGVELLS